MARPLSTPLALKHKVAVSAIWLKEANENGTEKHMESHISLVQTNAKTRPRTRTRRQLPPTQARDWMTPDETALALGCSVATVHRMRRGLIPGIESLPFCQYGRKVVFRKVSIARWQERTEKGGLAA